MYKLLITDDEKWIRKGVIAKLNYHGFKFSSIEEARDGIEALEIIKNNQPHIVITDVRMPNMDGIELMTEAAKVYPHIKFVMISGYAEFEYVQQAVNCGAKGYILKPISDENLAATINKVLEELDNEDSLRNIKASEEELKKVNERYRFESAVNELFNSHEDIYGKDLQEIYLKNHENEVQYRLAIIELGTKSRLGNEHDLKGFRNEVSGRLAPIENHCNARLANNYNAANQLFLIMSGADKETLTRKSEEYIARVMNALNSIEDIIFVIALSDVEKRVTKELYKQAKGMLNLKLIHGVNRVYKYKVNENRSSGEFVYPDNLLKVLSKCIEAKDFHNASAILKEIFSENVFNHSNCQYIHALYSECINMLVKLCNKRGVDMNTLMYPEMLTGEKLCSYNSREELVQDICVTMEKILSSTGVGFATAKDIISRTEKYIQEHYNEDLTVNQLAQKFLINSNYYSNLFSKEVGITLTKYITKIRMEVACRLLQETTINISDISANVGYLDTQYFYRVFKKELGMTPADYRSKVLQKV